MKIQQPATGRTGAYMASPAVRSTESGTEKPVVLQPRRRGMLRGFYNAPFDVSEMVRMATEAVRQSLRSHAARLRRTASDLKNLSHRLDKATEKADAAIRTAETFLGRPLK